MGKLAQTDVSAITEVLQLVSDGVGLGSAVAAGGPSFLDVGALVKVLQDLGPAWADKAKLLPEFLSLQDDDRATLEAWVNANITIPASSTATQVLQLLLDYAIASSKLFQVLGVQ
jgi:hypothetical protein